ncbi:MAG: enoyl-CoA hydratase-related protein [Burkholderiaceae bacterium]
MTVEHHPDAVVLLRLNRPQARNALNASLRIRLVELLQAADANEDVRCIVLAGDAKAFSAGADLNELQADVGPIDMLLRETGRFWNSVASVRKPLVAAVRGRAFGGGCELAMLADILVAGRTALFGLPEVKVGLMPGAGGTQRLPRLCGNPQALLALLTGEPFDAEAALRMGLVSEVVDDEVVESRALVIAATIAARPPLAIRQIKQVVRRGADCALESALALETAALQVLLASEDRKEGVRAFLEKRAPVFTGR